MSVRVSSTQSPSKRQKVNKENDFVLPATPLATRAVTRPKSSVSSNETPLSTPGTPSLTFIASLAPKKHRTRYQNGYEVKPRTPSFKPYTVNNPGHARQKVFSFNGHKVLTRLDLLSKEEWNTLALRHGLLKEGQTLRDYQIEAANLVISRSNNLCVIAPTGAGKFLVWMLPLLAQESGISLVIVPFTSLGFQGEERCVYLQKYSTSDADLQSRHQNSLLECTFLHSGASDVQILEGIAKGRTKHVVYSCVEMLETPAVARVLHSESFREQLSAVYLDEAHTLHESTSWRPGYTRLHLLRKILGSDIPFVPLSATLPELYRKSIVIHAGLKPDYKIINLGNHRPELSMIVARMQHDANSFQDLAWVLPWNSTPDTILPTIIYSDNLDMLTEMFWWFHARLGAMRLPDSLVDLIHAGLSEEHQKTCTQDFINGRVKILLGSDKIGAGMDFPHVQVVVQYRCRDLTIVKLVQRCGRGARRKGCRAVGVVLVEKSMTGDDGELSVTSPKFEDAPLLDLLHTSDCLYHILDIHLENPPRYDEFGALIAHCVTRCSNCSSSLRLQQQLTWIMETFPQPEAKDTKSSSKPSSIPTKADQEKILEKLVVWRLEAWKDDWMVDWPLYGPDSLVSDSDLHEITKRAHNVSSVDILISFTHIPHAEQLAAPLFATLRRILYEVCGIPIPESSTPPMQVPPSTTTPRNSAAPSSSTVDLQFIHSDPTGMSTLHPLVTSTRAGKQKSQGKLAHGETVLTF